VRDSIKSFAEIPKIYWLERIKPHWRITAVLLENRAADSHQSRARFAFSVSLMFSSRRKANIFSTVRDN